MSERRRRLDDALIIKKNSQNSYSKYGPGCLKVLFPGATAGPNRANRTNVLYADDPWQAGHRLAGPLREQRGIWFCLCVYLLQHLRALGVEAHVPPQVALSMEHETVGQSFGVEVVSQRHAFVAENQPHLPLKSKPSGVSCARRSSTVREDGVAKRGEQGQDNGKTPARTGGVFRMEIEVMRRHYRSTKTEKTKRDTRTV